MAPSKAEIEEARALAREVGLEYVDLDRYPLNAAAASLLPEQLARRHHALAVGWKYGTPVVAVAAPDNVLAMDDIRTVVGRDIHAVVACGSQIDAYIERMYNQGAGPAGTRAATGEAPAAASAATSDAPAEGGSPGAARPQTPSPPAKAAAAAPGMAIRPVAKTPAPPPKPQDSAVKARQPAPPPPPSKAAAPAAKIPPPPPGKAPAPAAKIPPPPPGKAPAPGAKADRPPDYLPDDVDEPDGVTDLTGLPKAHSLSATPAPGVAAFDTGDSSGDATPALATSLVETGQVTPEEMQAAMREAQATGRKLGEILSELGLVTEEDLIRAMAEEAGLEFIDLNEFPIDAKAIQLIPEAMARRHQLLAIGYRDNAPIIAMANPSNVFAMDDLRTVLGRDIVTAVSSPRQISEYVSRMYRTEKEASEAATKAAATTQAVDAAERQQLDRQGLHTVVDDAPIVKYVNLILRQALQERASDVHIEPAADDLRVRFRIDGVLHDITRSPKAIHGGVTTRLKVMANLDIAEHRVPQDGRISLTASDNRQIDLRVATMPTVHGEKVVMRILDKTNAMMDLGDLGFLPGVHERYKESYRKPYGTILVTGPTGSGKSTTLYATLNALNNPERNLITVEDPVEYQLPGVNQVQVNPKAGLTFAGALRSILRSDPDIILVGEIRDRETAVIAIEAALTGHLVLSSLHTNDASGTPMRLVEMGVEPFLVSSALDCVVAQRLARQLCENCSEPHEPTDDELAMFGWSDEDAPPQGKPRFRRAVGCQACSRTGYKGRIALHELLVVSEEVEKSVIRGTSAEEIDKLAIEQGMVPIRHDGLRKAALGLTSLEEVIRVVV